MIFSVIFFVFLASCATAPRASLSRGHADYELSQLPAGARAYIWADVERGRPLLETISFIDLSGRNMTQILDRTGTAAAAIFPEGQDRRFFVAASGNYPGLSANFSLTVNSAWKKQRSVTGNSYWYSQADNIALALGSNLALVSDTDPFEEFRKVNIPRGFSEFRRGMVLAGWLPNPSRQVNNVLATFAIPIHIPAEDFFFGVARVPADSDPWELVFRIRTASTEQAVALLSLFSMARFFVQRAVVQQGAASAGAFPISPQEIAAMLFAKAPEQNEEFLTLRTGPLDEDRIALLFVMFSLYSD